MFYHILLLLISLYYLKSVHNQGSFILHESFVDISDGNDDALTIFHEPL